MYFYERSWLNKAWACVTWHGHRHGMDTEAREACEAHEAHEARQLGRIRVMICDMIFFQRILAII